MITLQITGGGFRVETADGVDGDGNPVTLKVLCLVDPTSGITAACAFSPDAVDKLIADLRGGPAIAVVPAAALPRPRG